MRMGNAMEKWNEVHMITQAAEYLMLMNEETTEIPEEYFDYPGYSLNIYTDDADELPEEFNGIEGQIPLKKLVIELVRERDDKTVETVIIDKLSYEEQDYNKNFFHTTLPGNAEQSNADCGLRRLGRRYGMLVLRPLPLG
jgi:hypothetical protein